MLVQPEVTECGHMRLATILHYGSYVLYERCTLEKGQLKYTEKAGVIHSYLAVIPQQISVAIL